MPRWLLLVLVGLVGALWWLAHLGSAPQAATLEGSAARDACRLLAAPASLEGTVQTEQSAPAFRAGGASIRPIAGFSLAGRVLSREDYSIGREADFSPIDLALGWGPMAEPGLAERLSITQGARWYRYEWGDEGPPMPPSEIATNSANMHMVPADAGVALELDRVAAGDRVRLDGWLVHIDGDDGWHWRSSLSRSDTGAGACEIVLVCRIARQ